MTVYVDDAMIPFGRMRMSHLFADSDAELHALAAAIGIKRQWHQDKPGNSHYDVCKAKRQQAIAAGAVPVTWRQYGAMVMCRRRAPTRFRDALPAPEEATGLAAELRRARRRGAAA